MSWCKCVGAFAAGILLSSCAMQPLYQKDQGVDDLHHIKIATIADKEGQHLRNQLVSLLTPYGQPKKPLYLLNATLVFGERAITIRQDATMARKEMTATLTYTLNDLATKKVLKSGALSSTSSVSLIDNKYYANIAAKDFGRTALFSNLTQLLRADLTVYFQSIHP